MPRSFNQKLKILYLMKIFQERTDREHAIPVKEIVSILHSWGIKADRKTIYADIEALQYFGMKIGHRRGADAGYFLEDRVFELPELKFLMDTVQSSHFITQEQTQKRPTGINPPQPSLALEEASDFSSHVLSAQKGSLSPGAAVGWC